MSASAPSSGSAVIRIKVLFFAAARELAGVSATTVELPCPPPQGGVSPQALRHHLAQAFPSLHPIIHDVTLALNLEYLTIEAESQVTIKDGDEVALIPPISGG